MLPKVFEGFAKLSCRWRYGRRLSACLDNELKAHEAGALAGHLRECARCRVEFEQLSFANRALVEFEIPAMRSPLAGGHVFRLPAMKKVSPLKRLYSQKIAVPLPLAAVVLITLISATWFASNPRTSSQSTLSVPGPQATVVKVVEVPVERVVTRTVYLKQPGSGRLRSAAKKNEFVIGPVDSKGDVAQNAGRTEWSDSTLKDFRPAASANLRLVKEHEE